MIKTAFFLFCLFSESFYPIMISKINVFIANKCIFCENKMVFSKKITGVSCAVIHSSGSECGMGIIRQMYCQQCKIFGNYWSIGEDNGKAIYLMNEQSGLVFNDLRH